MSEVLNFLIHRHSYPKLMGPAPSHEQLDAMFSASIAAPDHGQLQPYRFRVFDTDHLTELGEHFENALREESGHEQKALDKARNLPTRAPMVIVAICHQTPDHPKAPAQEQLITAALATFQVINAAEALGFGAYWRTGDLAYKASLAKQLKLKENESIIGFIYVGTPDGEPKPSKKSLTGADIWRLG